MAHHRSYTSGRYALELDHVSAGWIFSAEGGTRVGEVVQEKTGQDHIVRKHIAGLKHEDISISCGMGMSKEFYKWLHKTVNYHFHRANGAIHHCDFDGNILSSLEFHRGLISEIGLPALDSTSKDAAKLNLKVTPEWTRNHKGGGKVNPSHYSLGTGQQKLWSPANFRLRIDDLEHACKKVSKVEALSIKQKNTENQLGELREFHKEPAALEIPNLVVTLPESHAHQFWEWEKDFLIMGNCSEDNEKTGTLEYLTPDLDDVLFSVTFKHLGLFKITRDKLEAHAEGIRRVKCEMYCEEMEFDFGDESTWT